LELLDYMRSSLPVAATTLFLSLAACAGTDPITASGVAGLPSGGATTGGTPGASGSVGVSGGGASGSAGSAGSGGGASAGASTGGAGTSSVAGGGAGGVGGTAGAAGSAGASGSGGAGGSAAYNPCPTNGTECKIMPLGDSITDGCCGENTKSMGGSYRVELFHLSLMNNKKLTFVGSHSSGPGMVDNVAFPKKQEGHAGWTIADGGGREGLQDQVEGWLKATPPDIVTLMIGTNDVDIQLDLPNAPKRLGALVDTITKTSPNALVVVAQMVPTRTDSENTRVQAFNAGLPAVVKTFADAGKHVILVDMYGAYTKNADYKNAYLANGLHPSDAGYAVMANTWWAAIGNLLPNK
jgi:lysophospholipase L1-like esterase